MAIVIVLFHTLLTEGFVLDRASFRVVGIHVRSKIYNSFETHSYLAFLEILTMTHLKERVLSKASSTL